MTPNQTIDGVPVPITDDMNRLMVAYTKGEFGLEGGSETVEAMSVASFDAVESQGHDADSYMSGYCAAMYEQAKPFVWLALLPKSTQPQGEPVAWRFRVSDSSDWFATTKASVAEMFHNSSDGGQAQPLYAEQPAPVADPLSKGFTTLESDCGKYKIVTSFATRDDAWSAYRVLVGAKPAPVAAVPDGYCIMPRQLTAENGAKALLLGEFKLLVTKECPECCELEDPVEGCSICDGEGEYGQKHTIPWDQIKFIYSKAVSGLAMKAESAKSR